MVTIANVSPEERKITLVPDRIVKGKKKWERKKMI
jgi:hypothetical protein